MAALAGASALLVVAGLVFLPVYSTSGGAASSNGQFTTSTGSATLLAVNAGAGGLMIMLAAVGVGIAVGGVLHGWRGMSSARGLLIGFTVLWCVMSVIGLASIGMFMLPTAGLAVAAVISGSRTAA